MIETCTQCKELPVEYVSPGHWCIACWNDWWFENDGGPTEELKKECFLNSRREHPESKWKDIAVENAIRARFNLPYLKTYVK